MRRPSKMMKRAMKGLMRPKGVESIGGTGRDHLTESRGSVARDRMFQSPGGYGSQEDQQDGVAIIRVSIEITSPKESRIR